MRPISQKTRRILENDPRMKRCALAGVIPHLCSAKLEWHHALIYAGRQSDIPSTIISLCSNIHEKANRKDVKAAIDKIMFAQMSEEDFKKVPKLCRR